MLPLFSLSPSFSFLIVASLMFEAKNIRLINTRILSLPVLYNLAKTVSSAARNTFMRFFRSFFFPFSPFLSSPLSLSLSLFVHLDFYQIKNHIKLRSHRGVISDIKVIYLHNNATDGTEDRTRKNFIHFSLGYKRGVWRKRLKARGSEYFSQISSTHLK